MMHSPAPYAGTIERGSLIIYARDPYHVGAQNMYVVLDEAKANSSGKACLLIQSIVRGSRFTLYELPRLRPMAALASDCLPIEAFGRRIGRLNTSLQPSGNAFNSIALVEDRMLVPTTDRKWGAGSDAMLTSAVDDPTLFEIVKVKMLADAERKEREAA